MHKSKSKAKESSESILVSAPIRRPLHYSRVDAAAELGISHDVLYRLGQEHRIYQPAAKRSRTVVIFTDIQIRFISLVMRGKMEPDRAYNLWQCLEDQEVQELVNKAIG